MLDPDIATEDALRLLSRPDPDDGPVGPRGWTRRRFLQAIGAGVFGGATVGTIAGEFFGGDVPEAWAGTPIGPNDGITVVVTLYGGVDGLNVVVPHGDGNYYARRSNIAIPQSQVLRIDDQHGFAPQLTYLKTLYDAGQVAVVRGVGYANPDLSHFTSMAIWMNGSFGGGPSTGWIGRWLDGQPPATAELAAASLDSTVPLHLQGNVRRGAGIPPYGGMFGFDNAASDQRMYAGLRAMSAASGERGELHDAFNHTMRRQLDLAAETAPVFRTALPGGGELTRELTIAARLLNADLGLRFLDVSRGGFDTHDGQGAVLPGLLVDLNAGLQAFYATLQPRFQNRVTILVISEFGRTPRSNDSGGTDHGTSNPVFVIGSNVRGGLYGQQPSLVDVDRNGRMHSYVDFRWVYGTVLDSWMGGGASTILNGAYQPLGLYHSGPGQASPTTTPVVLGPSVASGYVTTAPQRVFDTRDGTGGRAAPLSAGETWSFALAGRYGIPADATAVALNLTAVDATVPTYVSVWPGGTVKPFTANLNPVPGLAVPNLVVGQLGPGGSASFYNNSGSVHLVADVVGWFTPSSNLRLRALTPARLLDTRDGSGGVAGPVGQGQTIDVKVTDRGGVPANAKAVALNVTVTEPSTGSYLTVFPTGDPRPLASSVNMVRGQTVPNMVIARVGTDGRVSVYNNTGDAHVVIDVVGAFATDAPGRLVAVQPARVLDTREGIGAPAAKVGQDPLVLRLSGQAGIPGSGVSAVLLNVTAVQPDRDTFVTVFPAGGDRPLASNLNAVAGQVIPNMVLARLGTNGSVALYNNAGAVDLVADVMGYFTS